MHYSEDFKKKATIYFIVFMIIVFIDQVSKRIVLNSIGLNNSREFLPGILDLTVVQNTGGAFSILKQYQFIFKIIGVANILLFSYLAFCPTVVLNFSTKLGCACILGGTTGNIIDRFFVGGVIDFLDIQLFNFAVFNIADVFIDIGVVLIIFGWFLSNKKQKVGI